MAKQTIELAKEINQTSIERGQLGIWWLGQSGYAIKSSTGKVVFVDPYLSHIVSRGYPPYIHTRLVEPPLDPLYPPQVDLVLLTHEHVDHTDNGTILPLALATQARFVGPLSVVDHLSKWDIPEERIVRFDQGDSDELLGFKVQAVKALGSPQAVGYIVSTSDGICFYHSGDTDLFLGMEEIGDRHNLDVAFLCINGQTGNMGYETAILAARLLRPSLVVPNHYGMYADNTADPHKFAFLMAQCLPEQAVHILEVGRLFLFDRVVVGQGPERS